MKLREIYDQGHKAYGAGLGLRDNPHASGKERSVWLWGYVAAEDAAQKGQVP